LGARVHVHEGAFVLRGPVGAVEVGWEVGEAGQAALAGIPLIPRYVGRGFGKGRKGE
jgi:hypothetical protein